MASSFPYTNYVVECFQENEAAFESLAKWIAGKIGNKEYYEGNTLRAPGIVKTVLDKVPEFKELVSKYAPQEPAESAVSMDAILTLVEMLAGDDDEMKKKIESIVHGKAVLGKTQTVDGQRKAKETARKVAATAKK